MDASTAERDNAELWRLINDALSKRQIS